MTLTIKVKTFTALEDTTVTILRIESTFSPLCNPPWPEIVEYVRWQILEPLELCHRSLCETGDKPIADGSLLDFMRQVSCFGLSLVKLDIRQESERHTDALDAITNYLGIGSYRDWSEEQRQDWLLSELQGRRPLFGPDLPTSGEVKDVLDTFRVIAELPTDCFGAYIISMATAPSDVLAVELLQRECHVPTPLRVVPLFEKLADLESAPAALSRLFSIEWYLNRINGKQEVMIGYSDSGKDAGRLSAAWQMFKVFFRAPTRLLAFIFGR